MEGLASMENGTMATATGPSSSTRQMILGGRSATTASHCAGPAAACSVLSHVRMRRAVAQTDLSSANQPTVAALWATLNASLITSFACLALPTLAAHWPTGLALDRRLATVRSVECLAALVAARPRQQHQLGRSSRSRCAKPRPLPYPPQLCVLTTTSVWQNGTNCTWEPNLGSRDGAIAHLPQVIDRVRCCAACFASSACVLATMAPDGCFLHRTVSHAFPAEGVVGCATGRVPLPPAHRNSKMQD